MWNKDGTCKASSRPRSNGGGPQSHSIFLWDHNQHEEPEPPAQTPTIKNEAHDSNEPCAAGLSSKPERDPTIPCSRPCAHIRHRDALGSDIFSDATATINRQVSPSKTHELTGNSYCAEDGSSRKEISAAKKAALFSSKVFEANEETHLKPARMSRLKQMHLEGSESQAIITGSSTIVPNKRPVRGRIHTPGGASSIILGDDSSKDT